MAMSLAELAANTAAEMHQEAQAVESERLKIEARLREIDGIQRSARRALERLAHYRPDIGGEPQCPSCWVRDEVRSSMTAISSAKMDDDNVPSGHDAFRCPN